MGQPPVKLPRKRLLQPRWPSIPRGSPSSRSRAGSAARAARPAARPPAEPAQPKWSETQKFRVRHLGLIKAAATSETTL